MISEATSNVSLQNEVGIDILDVLQLQSGAVYLLVLDAFHSDAVTIEKVEWHLWPWPALDT